MLEEQLYPDCMVDIETTGLHPDRNAIIQIAAVRFNLHTGDVDSNIFNASMLIPNNRSWDEDTRRWWGQRKDTLSEISALMREPRAVLDEFMAWVGSDTDLVWWSKPLSFDFPFVQSYLRDYGYEMPFHFRKASDMNTHIRCLYGNKSKNVPECPLPFEGPAHNALFDTFDQIKRLTWHQQQQQQQHKG